MPLDDAAGSVLAESSPARSISPRTPTPRWTVTPSARVRGANPESPNAGSRGADSGGPFPGPSAGAGSGVPDLHRRRSSRCGHGHPAGGHRSGTRTRGHPIGSGSGHQHQAGRRGHPAGRIAAGGRGPARPAELEPWPPSPSVTRWCTGGLGVAILASGDEIVDLDQPDEILSGRKIASSNSHTLIALVRGRQVPVSLGIAADTPASVESTCSARQTATCWSRPPGSASASMISAGAIEEAGRSVLATPDAARRARRVRTGARGALDRTARQPGEHHGHLRALRLPAIRTMMGHRLPFRRTVRVRTAEMVGSTPSCSISQSGGRRDARWAGGQADRPPGSGILTSMIRANALLIVPEASRDGRGAELPALLLDDPRHQAEPSF